MSSLVRFAAMIPASWAVASASPFGSSRSIRAVSDFVSQKLSTIDRVQATATHFVLKAYKREGVAFAEFVQQK